MVQRAGSYSACDGIMVARIRCIVKGISLHAEHQITLLTNFECGKIVFFHGNPFVDEAAMHGSAISLQDAAALGFGVER